MALRRNFAWPRTQSHSKGPHTTDTAFLKFRRYKEPGDRVRLFVNVNGPRSEHQKSDGAMIMKKLQGLLGKLGKYLQLHRRCCLRVDRQTANLICYSHRV